MIAMARHIVGCLHPGRMIIFWSYLVHNYSLRRGHIFSGIDCVGKKCREIENFRNYKNEFLVVNQKDFCIFVVKKLCIIVADGWRTDVSVCSSAL